MFAHYTYGIVIYTHKTATKYVSAKNLQLAGICGIVEFALDNFSFLLDMLCIKMYS